jgi:hypothetical protein
MQISFVFTYRFFAGPATALFILSVAGAPLCANPVTVPADPAAVVEQGGEVSWGNFGATAASGFSGFTTGDRNVSFQVGYVPAAPNRPYRREMIFFRLPPLSAQRAEISKAEVRLVSNGRQDKSEQLEGRELRVFHQALRFSPSSSPVVDGVNEGTKVAAFPVGQLPTINRELRIDVTDALRAQLRAGGGMVAAFRFELSDDLDIKPGEAAFIQFRGFHTPIDSDRPILEITFR